MQRTILKTAVIKQKNSKFFRTEITGDGAGAPSFFHADIIWKGSMMELEYQQNGELFCCHISSEDTYHIVYLTLPGSVCEKNQKAKAGIENKIR